MIPLHHAEDRQKEFVRAINQLIRGLSNAKGTVTLNASATTTTVTNENITASSYPQLQAGTGTWSDLSLRVSSIIDGAFTITHASEAATNRAVFWHI